MKEMSTDKKHELVDTPAEPDVIAEQLAETITELVYQARDRLATEYSRIQAVLNWQIGCLMNQSVLDEQRADYGKTVVKIVSSRLTEQYGRGFSPSNLWRMLRFSKLFPDKNVVLALSERLSWSHFTIIIAIEEALKRDYYAEMCRIEAWSVRMLRQKIKEMFYERTGLSKKPDALIRQELNGLRDDNKMSPDLVFHDPAFLAFTRLKDQYSESDLEDAIINNLTDFIQELGSDFCFIARQKRMPTQNKDRKVDLLFYHRGLSRLIAFDIKIGPFEPSFKGQMEWYLNWLNEHERRSGEGPPLGIILCANKDDDDIKYLELDKSGIRVIQYVTELPPRDVLEQRLRLAIKVAREQYERQQVLKFDDSENEEGNDE